MLFNCSHPDVVQLTTNLVNSQTTQWLNEFKWTECIGHLDNTWNWLVNHYDESDNGVPKALHYVDGGPWLPDHEKTEYGSQWTFAYNLVATKCWVFNNFWLFIVIVKTKTL